MQKNNAAAASLHDGENLKIILIKMLNNTKNTGFPCGLRDPDQGSIEMKLDLCVCARGVCLWQERGGSGGT